jgi:NTP pyrophosphatase (non-canonical NTP hydrolase)
MSDTDIRTARSDVLRDMQAEVMDFCHAKGWAGPGSAPVTFGDTMALLHSEVSEALEAFRDHGLADATQDHYDRLHGLCVHGERRSECAVQPGPAKPEGVGSEFADVLIRLLDDCDRFGIDLAAEFDRKMAYNRTRAYQHGGRTL